MPKYWYSTKIIIFMNKLYRHSNKLYRHLNKLYRPLALVVIKAHVYNKGGYRMSIMVIFGNSW